MSTTPLRAAAFAEAFSLVLLLANLATVHWKPITTLGGPVHGCAYLAVIALTFALPGSGRGARLRAFVPVIGGYLVLRRVAAPVSPGR
ncbi:hypothetical protein [Amycolatopsis anabasis]|uniref:hypothetical protein n=1 Tax=Amycolatopsis anabasis TaxID=1840409 RepID=UPI00131BE1A3|nr:hypothetical protein [Amycolatopsis anabasis]